MKEQRQIEKICKKREMFNAIFIEGRGILSGFWGKVWFKHLEKVKDENYRLEGGSLCNSVIDLAIAVRARVRGSSNYGERVDFSPLGYDKWQKIVSHSTGKIDPLVFLFKRSFSKELMPQTIEVDTSLLSRLHEGNIKNSCPDWSALCNHPATVHRLVFFPSYSLLINLTTVGLLRKLV